jgi:hypothetical protein
MSTEQNSSSQTDEQSKTMGLWPIIKSVFAAGLGVQSSANRERDFKQGNAKVFFVAGLIFTIIFIGSVYGVVKLVLANAG